MIISRALSSLTVLTASLALAATATATAPAAGPDATRHGGALAGPTPEFKGGGGVAPAGAEQAEAAGASRDEGGAAAPPSRASQEDTPTAPEGEQQEGGQQEPGEETSPEPEQQPEPDEEVEPEVTPPADEGSSGGGADTSATSGLPSTGLEIAALATIGLALLTLGALLRPRRRVGAGRH